MKLYLKGKSSGVNATAEYNVEEKDFIVLKGSVLSKTISHSEKFRGASSIEKAREGNVSDNVLLKNVHFTSPSTAANFVTGSSKNGLVVWKDKEGKTLKQILSEMVENA